MNINNNDRSSLDPPQVSSSSSPSLTVPQKKRREESQTPVSNEQTQIISSSPLENTAMNELQQELTSREVEELLNEEEEKQPEEKSKRIKIEASENDSNTISSSSLSSIPQYTEETLTLPSSSIIFLANSSSSSIPLSLIDPRSTALTSATTSNNGSSSISISVEASSSSPLTFSFEALQDRASQKLSSTMTTQDITDTYNAFFHGETRTKAFSEEALSQDNPSSPSLPYVFKRLFDCISPLQSYGTFAKVLEARRAAREADQLDTFPVVTPLDLDPNSTNIHQVYFLRDHNNKIGRVFKPEFEIQEDEEGQKIKMRIGAEDISQREHTASLVNFHKQFPIPLTLKIDVLGFEGSAQLFVEGAIESDNLSDSIVMNTKALQSLLIFDLLFSNQDRNLDNIIFIKNEEEYFPFGIDHDACMCYGDHLKIQYLEINNAFDLTLNSDLESLVSPEKVLRYADIMRENNRPSNSINWMELVARTLKIYFSIEEERPTAKELHDFLDRIFLQIDRDELNYFEIDENYISTNLNTF